jgi:hypothetical protein
MKGIGLRVPEPPLEQERLPSDVVQAALMLKLLKAVRSIDSKITSFEEAVLKALESLAQIRAEIKTRIIRMSNVVLPTTLLDVKGVGSVRSLVLRSNSRDFGISLFIDDVLMLDNDFSWFERISPYVKEIAAFEENGEFVFVISDIKFTNSAKVTVKPLADGVVLKDVYISYDLTKD